MTQRITSLVFKSLLAFIFCFNLQITNAQTIYALTKGNQLLSFSAASPTAITKMTTITGLLSGQNLVGLDSRPRTGELYALGYNATLGMARLYKLNPSTGVLTTVGTVDVALSLGTSADNIGFDFNPTVDRVRVLSTNKKNYRLHPDLGTVVATDADLSYGMGDPNASVTPQIGQIAYTNSYVAATKTTLYYLDEINAVFGTAFVATNPNNGQIKTIGNTGLILNASDKTIDMDVAFDGQKNTIFLAANTSNNADKLYTINPATGTATLVGDIGTAPMEITDIAVAIDRTIPALKGNTMYALTTAAAARLVTFDDANPGVIRRDLPITGVKMNQTLVGMDMRPQDFKLYALGYNVVGDTMATIYTLNDSTGVATIFADSIKMNLGATANIGFDFNPVANRLRIVSAATKNNYRLNITVKPIKPTVDTALTFKTGDANFGKNAFVGSVAYINSFGGATATKMYDIDEQKGLFLQQNSPNGGFLNTIGSLGIALDTLDYSADFDIAPSKGANGIENTIFLTANVLGGNNYDNLYNINAATGATTLIGRIGNGIGVRDIASKLNAITTSSKELEINTLNALFFPNPVSQNLTVSFENSTQEAVNIGIFGINGAFLAQEKFAAKGGKFSEIIDLSGFETGIYFIRIQMGSKLTTQRVVKI
jgi:trimeric autotransporter adhesin